MLLQKIPLDVFKAKRKWLKRKLFKSSRKKKNLNRSRRKGKAKKVKIQRCQFQRHMKKLERRG